MGIPRFYRWMSERYPCLSETVREAQVPEFDNLYLDMNGIIHNCSHPNDNDVHFRISEEEIFRNVFRYTEFLFRIIKPKKVFFMAIDGVAPRAKMNQQRGRRFRAAKEAELKEIEARNRGEKLPNEARFDSNCITPGTEFMVKLHEQLKYFVIMKINTDDTWKKPKIYLSGHETPGEGEHKIMDFIRYQKSQPDYDPHTRHCLYGLDADLIKLGMCSHERYFSLLREEVKFIRSNDKKASRTVNPETITFHLLHLSLLREYLDLEFSSLKTSLSFEYDLECIIDDWVLMGFLVGNDFIPHIPHFHINKNSLSTLYEVYMKVMPRLDGYLNEKGQLNLDRFQVFLAELAQVDRETFSENLADLRYFDGKVSRKVKPQRKKFVGYFDDEEDDVECVSVNHKNNLNHGNNCVDDDCDASSSCDSFVMDENEMFEEEFRVHKKDYYETKLRYENVDESVLQEQAYCYVRAIQWNLHYYYNGCVSWSWYYPHHYAPYISDIKDFKNVDLSFELGEPFKPYEQLLAVLPAASKQLLPKAYQKLVTDENSPLIDYYPEDFEMDQNEKQQTWESVVLIPFIDEYKLTRAASKCYGQLSEVEKSRNKHGPHLLYSYADSNFGIYESSFRGVFPDIVNNHANCEELNYKTFWNNSLNTVTAQKRLENTYFPGFPTLKHVKFSHCLKRERIHVFEMPSQGLNMILTIEEKCDYELKSFASQYLGKSVLVNWPHLFEAKVIKVADSETMYTMDKNNHLVKCKMNDREKNDCVNKIGTVTRIYKERKGIVIGDTEVVLFVLPFAGFKYSHENGMLTVIKQWSGVELVCPIQTVVTDMNIYDSFSQEYQTLSDLFPVGKKCFVLCAPHYGEMAEVLEVNESNGKIKVRIFRTLEPDLTEVIERQNEIISQAYVSHYGLAQKLNLNSHLVSRITGSILVRKKKNVKVNVGLNLKFNSRSMEVPGFSKKKDDQWLFSRKAQQLVEDYMNKFPFIFENLNKCFDNDVFELSDLFPFDNAEEKLEEVVSWLKMQPSYQAKRQKSYADVLDEHVVKTIEDVLHTQMVFSEELDPVDLWLKPSNLFRPLLHSGSTVPDPNTKYNLFDRVVNIREGIPVPLGAKGIVIGRHEDDIRKDNTVYDIVFDDQIVDDMSMNCSRGRGYKLSPLSLINISFGNKSNNYGVILQSSNLRCIQTQKRDQRDRNSFSDERRISNHNMMKMYPRCVQAYSPVPTLEFRARSNPRVQLPSFSHTPQKINHSQNSPFESLRQKKDHNNYANTRNADYPTVWNELEKIQSEKRMEFSPPSPITPRGSSGTSRIADLSQNANESLVVKLGSAKVELEKYCKEKFGRKPRFSKDIMGPMRNVVVSVEIANNRIETLTVSPEITDAEAFEQVSQKVLKILNPHQRVIPPPVFVGNVAAQNCSLPKPPEKWISYRNKVREQDCLPPKAKIPESFVEANRPLLEYHQRQQRESNLFRRSAVDPKQAGDDCFVVENSETNDSILTEIDESTEKIKVWNVFAPTFVPLQVKMNQQVRKQKPQLTPQKPDILTPESIARTQNNERQRKGNTKNTNQNRRERNNGKQRIAVNFARAPQQ